MDHMQVHFFGELLGVSSKLSLPKLRT